MGGKETIPCLSRFELFQDSLEIIDPLGTSPLEYLVHSLDKETSVNRRDLFLLSAMILEFNQQIINPSVELWGVMNESSPSELFEEVLNAEKAEEIKAGVVSEVKAILNEDEEAIVFGPKFGSLPLLADLAKLDNSLIGKLYPVSISVSSGAELQEPIWGKEIPEEIFDKEKSLIIVDDLADGLTTTMAILHKRTGNERPYENNDEIVKVMRENNVLLAAAFSKNPDFYERLKAEANSIINRERKEDGQEYTGADKKWAENQLNLADKTHQLNSDRWVIGAGLLDIGALAPNQFQIDPSLKLRLGSTVEPLLALKGDNNDERQANVILLRKKFEIFFEHVMTVLMKE